ncbi:hypothetical protein Aab01nite_69380 [Paractinoplanes abujensis]|uniref:Excreted virulence factor EspC (Type VII ESX diderm) n=1 Tax=Paractinoplanes abujensis TaxID=882441 RepID=A0A7W7CWJ0_9ACTN|nr:hypothetical protein [Actinoplanes abujensis]MBB4695764.1 hypothetical protein [Actinoplanes abujensis]GID23348.1 hypothetical protein Aab01nite_69380 [Actinoplanes abujensis]
MDRLADSLERAADGLTALARELPALEAAPNAFAAAPAALAHARGQVTSAGGPSLVAGESGRGVAEGSGRPGRLGRALHERWAAALAARAHEASSAAARLVAMADSVRDTQRSYTETDEAVQRRFTREM